MNYIIIAIERDGFNLRVLNITLEIIDKSINVLEACKEAVREYIATDEGLKTYLSNCESFNWADFESYVPNKICERHGFRKINTGASRAEVNWDEELIGEPTFLITNIQWDTDGEEVENLPESCHLSLRELLDDDELLGDVSVEELKDRVADNLSDQFGFCVSGLAIE